MKNFDDEKEVFVVWSNTDLTEGRGVNYPLYVCDSPTTAKRMAENAGVQGTNADVYPDKAFRMNNRWYAPVRINAPSLADTKADKERDMFKNVKETALGLGLTEDEILILIKGE